MKLEIEATKCGACPGDGVVRAPRPGVDWPSPCSCKARRFYTQYTLGRLLDEDPKAIERVHELSARSEVSFRVLSKLEAAGLLAAGAEEVDT